MQAHPPPRPTSAPPLWEAVPCAVLVLTPNHIIQDGNPTALQLLDLSPDTLLPGLDLDDYINQDHQEQLTHSIQQALATGEQQQLDLELTLPLKRLPVRLRCGAMPPNADQQLICCTFIDISDLKGIAWELVEGQPALNEQLAPNAKVEISKEILQTIFNEIPVMLCFYDANGKIRLINQYFEHKLGWSVEHLRQIEIKGKPLPGTGRQLPAWDFMRHSRSAWRDFTVSCRNGESLECAWSSVTLSDGSQLGIGIDISERKRAERALKKLSRKILDVLENDRRAIAKELHDSIGANLAAIKFSLESKVDSSREADDSGEMTFEKIIGYLAETIKEMKRISNRLRPLSLDDLGFMSTLSAYLRKFEDIYPSIAIQRHIHTAETDIPEHLKIVLYRLIQEALNNVQKYSGADMVRITLSRKKESLLLNIADNGCGFDVAGIMNRSDPLKGYGLQSMRERIEICGGSIRIDSALRQGTRIKVRLSVKQDSIVRQLSQNGPS